ncbi:LOW QUALITY PROTEIN: hypothetical protein V2J09_017854, partial [Rumex salicifolius]
DFILLVKNQFGNSPRNVKHYLDHWEFSIKRVWLTIHNNNGVVERKHIHFFETARALSLYVYQKGSREDVFCLPHNMPLVSIEWKSPYELLFKKPPNYDNLKVIGCPCYMGTHKRGRDKFAARRRRSVLLENLIGYTVLDLQTKDILYSRDIVFYKNKFPYKSSPDVNSKSYGVTQIVPHFYPQEDEDVFILTYQPSLHHLHKNFLVL